MLIVSRFRDYYDVGMKMGVDKTCVFVRDTVNIDKGFMQPLRYSMDGLTAEVLAFCGKFYPFVVVWREHHPSRFLWTKEEAIEVIQPSNKVRRRTYHGDWKLTTLEGIEGHFTSNYSELDKVYHEHRTPVFGFTPPGRYSWEPKKAHRGLTLSPCLEDIEFYRVKDPITAFQEVSMFMSGVIGAPPKPMVEISDEIRAASRGHDGPYSFRKPPGKRSKNGRWR